MARITRSRSPLTRTKYARTTVGPHRPTVPRASRPQHEQHHQRDRRHSWLQPLNGSSGFHSDLPTAWYQWPQPHRRPSPRIDAAVNGSTHGLRRRDARAFPHSFLATFGNRSNCERISHFLFSCQSGLHSCTRFYRDGFRYG